MSYVWAFLGMSINTHSSYILNIDERNVTDIRDLSKNDDSMEEYFIDTSYTLNIDEKIHRKMGDLAKKREKKRNDYDQNNRATNLIPDIEHDNGMHNIVLESDAIREILTAVIL